MIRSVNYRKDAFSLVVSHFEMIAYPLLAAVSPFLSNK